MMVKVAGIEVTKARLRNLNDPAARKLLGAAIFAAADIVKESAVQSIREGAIQGKGHIPSKPGEPPKSDTNTLLRNIDSRKTGAFSAEVFSAAPYSAALEFGTSRMAERPFMKPAAAKGRSVAEALVRKAVRQIVSKKR